MSGGAMIVVPGTASLQILDDAVILDLVVIGMIANHGGTGVHLTSTLRADGTQRIPHPTSLGQQFVQEVPSNLFHHFQNRKSHPGKRRLHQSCLLGCSSQALHTCHSHESHRKFCAIPQ